MTPATTPSRRRTSLAWTIPTLLVLPFLMGANGRGCEAPAPPPPAGSGGDAATTCTPNDCAGLARSTLAARCSDGTIITASLCLPQPAGGCDWGFPACPSDGTGPAEDGGEAVDACIALPCPACPYGSTGVVGKDANGCNTCEECSPPPEECACPNIIVDCPNGTPAQTTRGPAPCYCPVALPCPGEDAGGPCSSDSDCSTGEICGFPTKDACAAKGTCFPKPGVECNLFQPGCACDGTAVNLACNGLPTGYSPKPLLLTGFCTDAG